MDSRAEPSSYEPFMRLLVLIQFTRISCFSPAAAAGAEQSALPLPANTHPSQPAALRTSNAADELARRFLDAWQRGRFRRRCISLLTFRNRELTPLDEFRAAYQFAQDQADAWIASNTSPPT